MKHILLSRAHNTVHSLSLACPEPSPSHPPSTPIDTSCSEQSMVFTAPQLYIYFFHCLKHLSCQHPFHLNLKNSAQIITSPGKLSQPPKAPCFYFYCSRNHIMLEPSHYLSVSPTSLRSHTVHCYLHTSSLATTGIRCILKE